MEAKRADRRADWMEKTRMADHTDTPRETPSQGIFIGRLALGLMIFAALVAIIGLVQAFGGHTA